MIKIILIAKVILAHFIESAPRLSKEELLYVVKRVKPLRRMAATQLLLAEPWDHHLLEVIHHVESLREEAATMLLNRNHISGEPLYAIFHRVPSLREEAGRKLLEARAPMGFWPARRAYLVDVMEKAPSLREQAWQKFLGEMCSPKEDLCSVLLHAPAMCEPAGKLLLADSPSRDELVAIIRSGEPLREQAWEMLITRHPSRKNLEDISRFVKPLQKQAEAALQKIS